MLYICSAFFYKDTIGGILLNVPEEWNAYHNSFHAFSNLHLLVMLVPPNKSQVLSLSLIDYF